MTTPYDVQIDNLHLPSPKYDAGIVKSKIDLARWQQVLDSTDEQILSARDKVYLADQRRDAENGIKATMDYYENEAKIYAYIKEHGTDEG
jgi:hypothetical protein